MRLIPILSTVFCIAAGPVLAQTTSPAAVASESAQWESEIGAFEAADRLEPPKSGGVLFVGSSSIRMWPNLSSSFPGIDVIQRGFGGSELSDVSYFAPRIVFPYKPRLIVLYAGDNDIAAGRSAEEVFYRYRTFVSVVCAKLPQARIAFISIKPSGSRWALVDEMKKANALIKDFAATHPKLLYVDVFTPMLNANGTPREDLFIADQLHMNEKGYALWQSYLDPIVREH